MAWDDDEYQERLDALNDIIDEELGSSENYPHSEEDAGDEDPYEDENEDEE